MAKERREQRKGRKEIPECLSTGNLARCNHLPCFALFGFPLSSESVDRNGGDETKKVTAGWALDKCVKTSPAAQTFFDTISRFPPPGLPRTSCEVMWAAAGSATLAYFPGDPLFLFALLSFPRQRQKAGKKIGGVRRRPTSRRIDRTNERERERWGKKGGKLMSNGRTDGPTTG